MEREALEIALEALLNSVDLVVEDAYNAEQLYGSYPTRQARIGGLKGLADKHREAITAAEEALAQPAQPAQEPLEYWNAVEGWVKIDEVRKHFDSVGCGTIYKTAGEDRVPVYTTPPQRPWVDLTVGEWLNWWRVSQVANKTEAEIDFADFLIIAQAVITKLKEKQI